MRKTEKGAEKGYKNDWLYILEVESQVGRGCPGRVEGPWEIIFHPSDFVDGKPKSGEGEGLAQGNTAWKWQAPNS